MGKSKIGIIVGREFSIRVKKKSFILTTILTPLLFAVLMIVPGLITYYTASNVESKEVLVCDRSGIVMPHLASSERIAFKAISEEEVASSKNNIKESGDENRMVLVIENMEGSESVSASIYSAKAAGLELLRSIEGYIKDAVEENKLESYDIPDLKEAIASLKTNVNLSSFMLDNSSEDEKESHVGIYMAIGYIASFAIYMFIFMFGSMVMRSVIEEKTTRIVEVIISSVKPFELMMGKILGVASVALTQFLIWIVLTFAIVTGVSVLVGGDRMADMAAASVNTEQIQQLAGENADQLQAFDIKDAVAANSSEEAEAGSIVSGILDMIGDIDYVKIIICFVVYFALGYLLYASLFAAVGSAVDNEADTQQLIMPITIPLFIGLFIMLHTFQNPDSALSFWASIIPFTSPMVMMARIGYDVPMWELALSISLLFVTFLGLAYISGKVYRTGILMYGKKPGWKDIYKWLKM